MTLQDTPEDEFHPEERDQPEEETKESMVTAWKEQRQERQRTQEDVKLLANRIALLKLAEKKVSLSPDLTNRLGKKLRRHGKRQTKWSPFANETPKTTKPETSCKHSATRSRG